MTVRRAHMVSKGYIRAWADHRGIVDVLDIQHGRGFQTSVENATIVSYVYEPEVLTHDLEGEYARIENEGIPVIRKLCRGLTPSVDEMSRLVAFLDMHRYRGQYADRADVRVPAVVLKVGGVTEDVELNLGDMLLLSRNRDEDLRLTTLGLERWPWTLWEVNDIPTGDGAVMLWGRTKDAPVSTVSFPLSPTKLLMIGEELPHDIPFKQLLARGCKRWIVGVRGSLNLKQAAVIAAYRAAEAAEQ